MQNQREEKNTSRINKQEQIKLCLLQLQKAKNIAEHARTLKSIRPTDLLDFFTPNCVPSADAFLVFNNFHAKSVDFFGLLIIHLIQGPQTTREQRIIWKQLVSIQINSRVSSEFPEFQNTLLHSFIVNEKWLLAQRLIDICNAQGIELTQVCEKDINGFTPLDLAIRLDVTPDKLIKSMFALHMKQLRTIDSQDDTPHPLLSSMILMYKFKKNNLLNWLETSYPIMYSTLYKAVQKRNITHLTKEQYSATLKESCVYSQRSVHADSNFMRIKPDGENTRTMHFFKNEDNSIDVVTNPAIEGEGLITCRLTENESKSYNFFVVSKDQAPWDPLFTKYHKTNFKVLAFKLENIILLCSFFMRILAEHSTTKKQQTGKAATTIRTIFETMFNFASRYFTRKVLLKFLDPRETTPINSNDLMFQTLEDSFRERKTPKSPNDTQLLVDDRVTTHGLNNKKYNDREGKIIGFRNDGRALVELTNNSTDPGKVIAVKLINCRKNHITTTSSQPFSEYDEKQANPGVTL